MRTFIASQRAAVDGLSLLGTGGVQVSTRSAGSARAVGSRTTKGAREHGIGASALDSQCLTHDGALAGSDLQVGHVGLDSIRAGAERAKRGGRSLVQEWAHAARLTEKGLHVDVYFSFVWVLEGREVGRDVKERGRREDVGTRMQA
jgi:hypothetical protein